MSLVWGSHCERKGWKFEMVDVNQRDASFTWSFIANENDVICKKSLRCDMQEKFWYASQGCALKDFFQDASSRCRAQERNLGSIGHYHMQTIEVSCNL